MADTFGRWLQRQLETRGWRQSELARRTGINTGAVSRWISGKARIRPESCLLVAEALGVSPEEVLAAAGYVPENESIRTRRRVAYLQAARALVVGFRHQGA